MLNSNSASDNFKKPGTFRGIQALRGIAAVMVVVHHSTLFWSRVTFALARTAGPPVVWSGAAGVDIFFVISGFVMAITTAGTSGESHPARKFLGRRLLTRSLFLVPGDSPLVVGVAWSLSFEVFFYLLFALALACKVVPVRLLTPLMLGLVLIGYFHSGSSPVFAMITAPMLLEFLAGVIIGSMVVD